MSIINNLSYKHFILPLTGYLPSLHIDSGPLTPVYLSHDAGSLGTNMYSTKKYTIMMIYMGRCTVLLFASRVRSCENKI